MWTGRVGKQFSAMSLNTFCWAPVADFLCTGTHLNTKVCSFLCSVLIREFSRSSSVLHRKMVGDEDRWSIEGVQVEFEVLAESFFAR